MTARKVRVDTTEDKTDELAQRRQTRQKARGKRQGLTSVAPSNDRVEIHFTALDSSQRGLVWDTMWDMLFKKLAPYALAIVEREQQRAA